MKIHASPHRTNQGFITTLLVVSIATVTLALLFASFRRSLSSQEIQSQTQLNIDYQYREAAFLNALLHHVPNHAIALMGENSSSNASDLTWEKVFLNSLLDAHAHQAVDTSLLTEFNITALSSNPGDINTAQLSQLIRAIPPETGFVSPGVNRALTGKYPKPLTFTDNSSLDALYPIISRQKEFGDLSSGYASLPYNSYPINNIIPYPDISFNYLPPGSPFIAKRNWWAFNLKIDPQSAGRNYVISLYEIPSQLPISASGNVALGVHENGDEWSNISIQGSVFGAKVQSEGSFNYSGISSQKELTFNSYTGAVSGETITTELQQQGASESYRVNKGAFLPISTASDSGRMSFFSINRGLDFYDYLSASDDPDRVSPTGWDEYSCGAKQCVMRVLIKEMQSVEQQIPTEIEFQYMKAGSLTTETFTKGSNWPNFIDPGGDLFPFHQEDTETGRSCLVVYLGKLQNYLLTAGADNATVNNSIVINVDYESGTNTVKPSFPTLLADMAVMIRDSEDLSSYNHGFSLVTHSRLYLADDLNLVSTTPPSGSTAPTPFFPPISIFAPEKRYGITAEARLIKLTGQLGNLSKNTNHSRILDLKSGADELTITENIKGSLLQITHPDELPPIHVKNWLVTVEQVK